MYFDIKWCYDGLNRPARFNMQVTLHWFCEPTLPWWRWTFRARFWRWGCCPRSRRGPSSRGRTARRLTLYCRFHFCPTIFHSVMPFAYPHGAHANGRRSSKWLQKLCLLFSPKEMLFSSFVYNTRSCGMGLRTGCVIMLRQRNLSLSFSPRVCSVKNFIPPLRGWLSLPTQAQTPPLRSGKNLGKILQIFPHLRKGIGWNELKLASIHSFFCVLNFLSSVLARQFPSATTIFRTPMIPIKIEGG